MARPGNLDHLQQVQELNRAFLGLLQARIHDVRPCFGLPPPVRPILRRATTELIDAVALFPRALFRLAMTPGERRERGDLTAYHDEPEHELVLSMLLAARHASRQSTFEARLLFGLEGHDVATLSALPLVDLQRLASTPGVLQCALRERYWFWHGLLTATRPELRRQLTLMALQPGVAVDWPSRRPPHASI
jgi:hypothetical protein